MTTEANGNAAHATLAELEASLASIREAPREEGTLRWIVRRPAEGEREVLEEARLVTGSGLKGDNWLTRGSSSTPDGARHPDKEINVMGARVIERIAGPRERWALAGDQLYVDLDLSEENLPPGTRLAIGDALLEVTREPHRGCAKFTKRFGPDAIRFVNSESGRALRLRGLNARIVRSGTVRVGDRVMRV